MERAISPPHADLFLTRADVRMTQSGLQSALDLWPTSPIELERKTSFGGLSSVLIVSSSLGDSESQLAAPLTTARQITDEPKAPSKERQSRGEWCGRKA
jgi:hypothetical protein